MLPPQNHIIFTLSRGACSTTKNHNPLPTTIYW